ncbi:MAG: hypothetical protein JWQ97_2793 [Phenylobacterium sp.]|nr:hypothetical protein [Phenylobacterium sp.]
MGEVHELQVRATRCRSSGFTTPVVASVADARALAQRIAGQLAGLSGSEALLCLASLHDIQAVLAERLARLQAEISETRRELERVRAAGRACRSYGAARTPAD